VVFPLGETEASSFFFRERCPPTGAWSNRPFLLFPVAGAPSPSIVRSFLAVQGRVTSSLSLSFFFKSFVALFGFLIYFLPFFSDGPPFLTRNHPFFRRRWALQQNFPLFLFSAPAENTFFPLVVAIWFSLSVLLQGPDAGFFFFFRVVASNAKSSSSPHPPHNLEQRTPLFPSRTAPRKLSLASAQDRKEGPFSPLS